MAQPNQILIQNTGAVSATPANPIAAAAGTIAGFTPAGAAVDLTSAKPAEFFLIQRTATGLKQTPVLKSTNIEAVIKQAYTAPVKAALSIASIPAGGSAQSEYTIRLINTTQGREPFPRLTSTLIVPASQTVPVTLVAFVKDINGREGAQRFVTAKTNRVQTVTLTGTSGTANITITHNDGTTAAYLATFATDLDTTAANFVTAHAATILAKAGIVVTAGGSNTLVFTDAGSETTANISAAVNASGNLAGTTAQTTAASLLILTAIDFGTLVEYAFDNALAGIPVVTATAPKEGSGTYEQVLALERQAFGATGMYYQDDNVLGSLANPETFAASGYQYNIYVIRYKNDIDKSINRKFEYQDIYIALEDSVTGNLDTFFGL